MQTKGLSPTSEINKAAMLVPRITGKVQIQTASNAAIFTFRFHESGIQMRDKFTIFVNGKRPYLDYSHYPAANGK
jgi:hypothetical protein